MSSAAIAGATVGEVLDRAVAQFGPEFAAVLETSGIWVNGEPSTRESEVTDHDEVAVLPPVSGGA